MGFFATLLVQIIASVLVSKVVTEITDNEILGAAAGMAAGVGVGQLAGGAAAAGEAGSSAVSTQTNTAGSTMGDLTMGGAVPTGAPVTELSTNAVSEGGFMSGMSDFVNEIDPNEWMKLGGGILKGINDGKIAEANLDMQQQQQDLAQEKFDFEKDKYNRRSAFGVTNNGNVVPINVGQGLQDVNRNVGTSTTLNSMNSINTIQQPDGGYLSEFGRFRREQEGSQ